MSENPLALDDEICDQALLLFYELASDNLPAPVVHRFNAQFPDHGYTESHAPDDSWAELVGYMPEAERFLQVSVAIEGQPEDLVLAKILMGKENSLECHVQWLPYDH